MAVTEALSLVPEQPPGCRKRLWSNWGTWLAQGRHWYRSNPNRPDVFATTWGDGARECMNESNVFGPAGWASHVPLEARSDLLLVLDDAFDVPYGTNFASPVDRQRKAARFGSLVIDSGRFPSVQGAPVDRLRQLSDQARDAGWGGLGLWVASQPGDDMGPGTSLADYYRERLSWCAEAGIAYWKVDWGEYMFDLSYRQMLTNIGREEAPHLIIEHVAQVDGQCNDRLMSGRVVDGDCLRYTCESLRFADVVRTYDCTWTLNIPVTLDRCVGIMSGCDSMPTGAGVLNCESNVYLAAGLGCAFGAMHAPTLRGVGDPQAASHDDSFSPELDMYDELTRAARWQRIAPPFGCAPGQITCSEQILVDTAVLPEVYGKESGPAFQRAPAIVSRNCPLPEVSCQSEPPYVVASRHPDGAYAIATLPRKQANEPKRIPLSDVTFDVGDGRSLIGVFGSYRTLTLRVRGGLGDKRVLAQDAKSDTAIDITDRVRSGTDSVTISGTVLKDICSPAQSHQDASAPGIVLEIR